MEELSLEEHEPLPPICVSDPAVVAASIVQLSKVELDQLRFWICPCCGLCKAVYAQDAKGRVWFGLTVSLHPTGEVIRIDALDEVDELVHVVRDEDERLLRAWYAVGLQRTLTQLFVS